MKIVAFIDDESGNENELEFNYEFFPIIGDFIIHNKLSYRVSDRYVISYDAEPMRAARVQYTIYLTPHKDEG